MEQPQVIYNGITPMPDTGKTPKKKRLRNLPSLPSVASASDMADAAYECKVETSPILWDALPLYGVFSLSSDGSYPKIKVHKSKFCDLRTGKSELTGSGRCYRVIF